MMIERYMKEAVAIDCHADYIVCIPDIPVIASVIECPIPGRQLTFANHHAAFGIVERDILLSFVSTEAVSTENSRIHGRRRPAFGNFHRADGVNAEKCQQ